MGSSAKVHSNEVGELSREGGGGETKLSEWWGNWLPGPYRSGWSGEETGALTPPLVAYWHFFSDPDEGEQEGLHTSLYYTQTDTQIYTRIDIVRYTQTHRHRYSDRNTDTKIHTCTGRQTLVYTQMYRHRQTHRDIHKISSQTQTYRCTGTYKTDTQRQTHRHTQYRYTHVESHVHVLSAPLLGLGDIVTLYYHYRPSESLSLNASDSIH